MSIVPRSSGAKRAPVAMLERGRHAAARLAAWPQALHEGLWFDLGAGVIAGLVCTGLRGVLEPLLEGREPYLPCIAMVVVVAALRGPRAAIVTALVGFVLAALLFVLPNGGMLSLTSDVIELLAAATVSMVAVLSLRGMHERVQRLRADNRRIAQQRDEGERFLAMTSHELRSPLSAARWAVAMLQSAGRDVAVVERATDILHRQLSQLGLIVDDLIAQCATTLGRLSIERREVDLRACVASATEATHVYFRAKHQRLTLQLPDAAVTLNVDAARITQALTNVLHNASKYSPLDSTILLVLAQRGEWVHVTVRDAGPGFGHADPAAHGLGLGLQLSRLLVELHHGTLQIDESSGPGAVVSLCLPRCGAHNPATHIAPDDALQR